MRLKDKVALVTGGGSGIGKAIAERFAVEGAKLVLADINGDNAAEVAAEIKTSGGQASSVAIDVRDQSAVENMIDDIVETQGGIDILINSAAVPQVCPILEMPLEDWKRVIDINLTGTFVTAQAAARAMVKAGTAGRIVNLSSVNGQRAITGRGAYTAAKGGVTMLTLIMAAELGPANVTVNAIAPGPVDTPMVRKMHDAATREAWHNHLPIKRYASPEDVANAALFLASDESGYITGHILNVDGGFNAAGMLFDLGGFRSESKD